MSFFHAFVGKRSALVAATLIVAAAAIGTILGFIFRTYSADRPDQASLQLDPLEVDFGTILPGATLSTEFHLINGGGKPLKVTDLETSCGCAPASIDRTTILHSEIATVTLHFQVPMHPGQVGHLLSFKTNDPNHLVVSVPIRARAEWPVEASPSTIFFPGIPLGAAQDRELEVYSSEAKPIKVLKIETTASWIKLRRVDNTSRRIRFLVFAKPPSLGRFSESIRLVTSSKDRPLLIIPVEGDAFGQVRVTPDHLLIGQIPTNTKKQVRFVIESANGTATIQRVGVKDSRWSVSDWQVDRKGSKRTHLSVTLRSPADLGHTRTTLIIEGEGWSAPLEVTISCTVVAAPKSMSGYSNSTCRK